MAGDRSVTRNGKRCFVYGSGTGNGRSAGNHHYAANPAADSGGRLPIFYILTVVLLLVTPNSARSGDSDSTSVRLAEGGYIELMDEYLAVTLRLTGDTRDFKVTSAGDDYDIRLNAETASRLAVSYRFITIAYGFFPGFIPGNSDDALKGDSEASSYSLNLNFTHWVQSLSYTRARGFYLHNTSDYVPEWTEGEDSYIQFPDLVYTGFDGFTAYKFNSRFSFKALSTQTERQRKSAGTAMPFIFYNYYVIDNRVALTGQNSSQKSNNLELMISLGYFYTVVLSESFYISGGLAPGAGIIFTKLLTRLPGDQITEKHQHPIYRLELQGALGYNARRVFAGAQLVASWEQFNQDGPSSVITRDNLTFQVFAGYRFDTPGFLARLVDRITGIF
jgi:hypothetical protein